MKTVCMADKCNGCMACIDICSKGAIQIVDEITHYNAVVDIDKCIDCGACRNVCPNNQQSRIREPVKWYQGWANREEIRLRSASGGLASALALSFIEDGGVCACIFDRGEFVFECISDRETLKRIAGSKYVKSNPKGIYRIIRQKLQDNEKILFIGLPCQVAAVKSFMRKDLLKNLYTIDLICHGTPSPRLLDMFLGQYDYSLKDLQDIRFRDKEGFRISDMAERIETSGIQDGYTMGFLEGLFYTDNCYDCPYAALGRTGDITLGDSWGSKLSKAERKKGISLILVQTAKGESMLDGAEVHLEAVDLKLAVASNGQLNRPVTRTTKRDIFFHSIQAGKNFNKTVSRCCVMRKVKQQIKRLLQMPGGYSINVIPDEMRLKGP